MKPGYSDRLYAALLRLLPFDFRSEFGGDMEETFRAQRDDAERTQGLRALLRMWWCWAPARRAARINPQQALWSE